MTYHYGGDGRLAYTSTEPEWDDYERALVDAYLDWKADLHSCGHPLTETLLEAGKPAPRYQAGFTVCAACLALSNAQQAQAKKDAPVEKAGGVIAHAARLWQVFRTAPPAP